MNDIRLTGTDFESICQLQATLHLASHMKDLGPIQHFLGLEIHRSPQGIFINQHKYTKESIALARFENYSFVGTSLEVNVKYHKG